LWHWGLHSGSYHLNHALSLLCFRFFFDRVSLVFGLGWPQTTILPIFASQVTGITSVSHCTWPHPHPSITTHLSPSHDSTCFFSGFLKSVVLGLTSFLLLLFFFCGAGTQCFHFEPLLQPFFVMGFIEIVSQTICLGWRQTKILLLSAS
jgi:hypothetical protein